MKTRPIIFSSAMINAILAGTKTQTRRVIKPQPNRVESLPIHGPADIGATTKFIAFCNNRPIVCPYGGPSDNLWARETWALVEPHPCSFDDSNASPPKIIKGPTLLAYWRRRLVFRAGHSGSHPAPEVERWRPSIFMPRWASRISLEITNIRVQHVQNIGQYDSLAEGVIGRNAYATLWDEINLKRGFGWESNPLVWAISFRLLNSTEVGA